MKSSLHALSDIRLGSLLNTNLHRHENGFLFIFCLAAWSGIYWIDVTTGPYIKLTLFYLIPIGLGAWYLGRVQALTLVLLSAAATTHDALQPASHPGTALIDFALNFSLFSAFTWMAFRLKAYLKEIHTYQDHLELLVGHRTEELAHAKELAEVASIAKSHFLANMSHELLTPLNAIMGMATLIVQDGLSPKQGTRMEKLQGASERLLNLINGVLELTRFDSETVLAKQEPIDIPKLLTAVISKYQNAANIKKILLIAEMNSLNEVLLGDEALLNRVLSIYVENAIKFTQSGEIVLGVTKLEESDQSMVFKFEVKDTGIGISTEELPRLFNLFEQADSTPTRKYGGMGIGLAIVQRIARLLRGKVGADTSLGTGSVFWFEVSLQRYRISLSGRSISNTAGFIVLHPPVESVE